ncbi:MAG: hypothetical protein ACLS90_04370 [Clostridia bacterium]|jgi:hypothetical protein
MEDKIEVNEYVRTKDGIIDKVIIEYDGKCNNSNCSEKHISCKYNYYNEKDIVKHSKQLIEIGDFVNGYRVTDKYLFAGEMLVLETKGNGTNCKYFCEKDIKIILTKESYMANCYKVGGEE